MSAADHDPARRNGSEAGERADESMILAAGEYPLEGVYPQQLCSRTDFVGDRKTLGFQNHRYAGCVGDMPQVGR